MFDDRRRQPPRRNWTDYREEVALAGLNGGRFAIGQLGQSLDGRIATPTGASKYINGRAALGHLHRLRAAVDAVVIGVGTAVADDPQLTTRLVDGPNPVRVVIDPTGRLWQGARMLRDGAAPVLIASCPGSPLPKGAARLAVPCDGCRFCPAAILDALAALGLTRVLVEGGADTLGRFLDAGVLDELHLMVAPIVLGSGKTGLNLAPIDGLEEALRPDVRAMRMEDGDMLAICTLGPC